MPSFQGKTAGSPAAAELTDSERFTLALVELTRTVWHPDCSFDTAIGAIAQAAARALQVERVSVWQYRPGEGLLQCMQVYNSENDTLADTHLMETLSLEGDDYMKALQHVRTFHAEDAAAAASSSGSRAALCDYLQRHRIRTLLDAPACLQGELQGVISHESTDRSRKWTPQEITFAASMGDYVAMAYEIARRRSAELEVQHLLLHDAATGLPNRDYMVELVRHRSEHLADGEALAVVFVHVDAFGTAAASASAPSASSLMVSVAQELRPFSLNAGVELARVRDDGLAFLLSRRLPKQEAIRLAERCLSAVQRLNLQDDRHGAGASVGIAFGTPEHARDPRLLLRQAEEAAKQASEGDRYRYEVFDPARHDSLIEELRFERRLRQAFSDREFEVHYQPEYDAVERTWVAAEALLRWRDGDRLATAAEFIGVVESCGLILPLGTWVLRRACTDAMGWPPGPGGRPRLVRINVSGRQFNQSGLVDDVQAALAASGLPPDRLTLEITETTLLLDIDRASDVLSQLRALGVGVAIDDFGTGYASLTYLRRLPVDVLKIDRSFVEHLPGAAVDSAIVTALVGLAYSLGMHVVAEGVETSAQEQALLGIGVQRMQGWLYGKAVPHAELCRLMEPEAV